MTEHASCRGRTLGGGRSPDGRRCIVHACRRGAGGRREREGGREGGRDGEGGGREGGGRGEGEGRGGERKAGKNQKQAKCQVSLLKASY